MSERASDLVATRLKCLEIAAHISSNDALRSIDLAGVFFAWATGALSSSEASMAVLDAAQLRLELEGLGVVQIRQGQRP